MGRICSRCGALIREGERHVCPMRTQRKQRPGKHARTKEEEAARAKSEPFRDGYGAGWRKARNACIARSGGACVACGAAVYVSDNRGGWRKVRRDFGGVHHLRPLSAGGTNDPANIVVLCAACHGRAHKKGAVRPRKG